MAKLQLNKYYETKVGDTKVLLTDSPEVKAAVKKKAKIKWYTWHAIAIAIIVVIVLNVVIMPATCTLARVKVNSPYTGDNQYIINDNLYLSAHRAGGGLEPEETKAAFKRCIETADYKVDVLEFDLHLTKDGKLVLLHDHELGRTSNGEDLFFKGVKVCDLTLEELETVNFGYNFQDPETGELPYHRDMTPQEIKDAGVGIFLLTDLLDYVEGKRPDKSMHYIIEIKDNGDRGEKSMDLLYETMVNYGILDRTVVGTFHGHITKYIDKNFVSKGVVRSASISEVLNMYYSFLYGVKKDYKFGVLQIPQGLNGFFDLGTKAFIDYAHSLDIAVQYWTINDAEDVKKLAKNGADCIMTDDPKMAAEALMSIGINKY